jgi:hypothetical protein
MQDFPTQCGTCGHPSVGMGGLGLGLRVRVEDRVRVELGCGHETR